MNHPNSLTSAWQQDETSKEAGNNSMAVKPLCGDPEISKSQRQGEEHMTKAKLPESQTETGGSHSLPTPDKGQHPYDARSSCCASGNSHRGGADSKSDNGRTGRLSAHRHFYLCTTGSPTQEDFSCMATESPYYSMCRVNARGSQRFCWTWTRYNHRAIGGKTVCIHGGRETVEIPRRTFKRRTTNVDR
jgi:hypothetical protein